MITIRVLGAPEAESGGRPKFKSNNRVLFGTSAAASAVLLRKSYESIEIENVHAHLRQPGAAPGQKDLLTNMVTLRSCGSAAAAHLNPTLLVNDYFF